MKRLTIAAVLAASLVLPASAQQWFTNGVQTNPGAGAVLADTGPINVSGGANPYICLSAVVVSATVNSVIILQHRNAANTADVQAQGMVVAANTSFVYPFICVALADQERVRVIINGAVTGSVWASIHPQ